MRGKQNQEGWQHNHKKGFIFFLQLIGQEAESPLLSIRVILTTAPNRTKGAQNCQNLYKSKTRNLLILNNLKIANCQSQLFALISDAKGETMQALIVIDAQNDFCPQGALAVPTGNEIVQGVNALMPDFDAVILTQDWHPAGHSSFASAHPDHVPYDMIDMPYGPQVLWPDHCIQGSMGAKFHTQLQQDRADLIIRKGYNPAIDSYSAFFENDHKTPTGLEGYLRTRGIDHLVIVGLALDFCVNFSAVDAAKLGFDVEVRQALTRAIDLDGSLNAALEGMQAAGVKLT